jgi:hypothetical protein
MALELENALLKGIQPSPAKKPEKKIRGKKG